MENNSEEVNIFVIKVLDKILLKFENSKLNLIRKLSNIFTVNFILFGFIIDLIFIIFIVERHNLISRGFLSGYILGLIWVNIGPLLIWIYKRKLFNNFFKKMEHVTEDKDKLKNIYKRNHNNFSKRYFFFSYALAFIVAYSFITNIKLLYKAGLLGFNDFFLWFALLVSLWVCFLGGIGFNGVITTVLSVLEISKLEFKLNTIAHDGHFGLGFIPNFVFSSLFLFSTGYLFVPIALQIIFGNMYSSSALLMILVLLIAIFLILISVLIPLFFLKFKVDKIREKKLSELIDKIDNIHNQIQITKTSLDKILKYVELSELRQEYFDLCNIRFYSITPEILFQSLMPTILPILISVFELLR